MKRAHSQVCREMADAYDVFKGTPHGDMLGRWLAVLAPPKKKRPRVVRQATKARRIETRALDARVREIVRKRDGDACRRCGRMDAKLDVSHVFAKGSHRWLRWDLDNVKLLCAIPCHLTWWHGHPEEAMKWWEKEIGPQKMQALRMRAARPSKTTNLAVWAYLEQEQNKLVVVAPTREGGR